MRLGECRFTSRARRSQHLRLLGTARNSSALRSGTASKPWTIAQVENGSFVMEEEKSLELDYQIAREQDGERCNDFYNRTYSTDRSLEGWQWEFATDSKPDDKLPFVFIEGHGDILGTQAYIPITMIDQNGVFATAKSEETLLHPKLRGKNAFANMYEILFAIARQNDVHGIWGFTPAGKAFRRIGFETPSSVTQLLKPRRIGFISRMRAAANEAAKASFLVDTLAGLAALAVSRTVSLFRRKTDL